MAISTTEAYASYVPYASYRMNMKGVTTMGIMGLRTRLAERIEAAFFHGEHTVVKNERRDEPRAVLVPYTWWFEQLTPEQRAAAEESIRTGQDVALKDG
jgi:hypothetical protein